MEHAINSTLPLNQEEFTWNGKDRPQSVESRAGRISDLIDESKPWPYTHPVVNSIKYRQNQMDGELFIHLLLKFAGVEPSLYPPVERATLKELSNAIYSSTKINELQSHCLMYYILRDWNMHHKFAVRYAIPYGWMSLMDGFWSLDQWRFEEAIRFLGEPEVKKVDYNHKVIQTLFNHAGPREAMLYVDITKPDLTSKKEDVELLFDLLMRCDLMEALFYLRNQPEEFDKALLFRKLLDYCFNEAPRAEKLNKLLSFPLNKEEELIVEDYCLKSDNPVCLEFYMMYAVHHDRKIEAIKLYDRLRRELKDERATAASFLKRGKIIEDIRRNLSPIEKQLLSQEYDSYDIIKVNRPLKSEKRKMKGKEPISSYTLGSFKSNISQATSAIESSSSPKQITRSSNQNENSFIVNLRSPLMPQQANQTISPPSVLSPLTSLANKNVFTTSNNTGARSPMTTPLPNKSPFSPTSTAPSPSTVKSSIKKSEAIRHTPYLANRRITRSMTRKQPTPYLRTTNQQSV
ncbi:4982_t:CDS:2 [Ambispora gerdemannii]|uniref:4982_t:CDS:1 n=1 Tax=Ambispora gerdemannii TaxID=144530 RepID=A0A9N8WST3_9GLOM|nr:4982_t:CDS:2 [Ambispora gerdemannii]